MVFITLERSILILLDLSEAFDTVDHVILIDCLEHKVNIRHVVLCWLSFYVAHRIFSFTVSVLSASLPDITCGVPQGSVLGLAFLYINIYMLFIADKRSGIGQIKHAPGDGALCVPWWPLLTAYQRGMSRSTEGLSRLSGQVWVEPPAAGWVKVHTFFVFIGNILQITQMFYRKCLFVPHFLLQFL